MKGIQNNHRNLQVIFRGDECYFVQVYFVGPNAKKQQSIIDSANNNGYDDDQGSYVHVPHDHVAYRYEVLRMLGKGSFGQVVKVYDHKERSSVALKMVLLLSISELA